MVGNIGLPLVRRVRRRTPVPGVALPDFGLPRPGRRRHVVASRALTVLAALLVLFGLLAPDDLSSFSVAALVRVPVEGLVIGAVLLVLPPRARRVAAVLAGLGLGLLTLMKALDTGFYATLEKPFDPVYDWSFFHAGVEFLAGQIGNAATIAALVGAGLLAVAVVVLMVLAMLRLSRVAAGRRTGATRVVAVLSVVWIVSSVFGVEIAPGQPVAAQSAAALAYGDLRQVGADLRDQRPFEEVAAEDAFRSTPGPQLLNGLRGKNVVLTFVESYGRIALDDPVIGAKIGPTLDAGTAELRAAGIGAKSAFLSSSTFGGGSWLAHSTVQSGMWIDNQQRYNDLLAGDRLTLGGAFQRAGWRTVWDVPAHTKDWPEGQRFYHPDAYYDARSIGYHGPGFAYATMPDQFSLSMLQRKELANATPQRPVMAEVDLVSSHAPWSPRPWLVDWNQVGDGSIFNPQPAAGEAPESVWKEPSKIREAYRDATDYSLKTVISFVKQYGDENTVLVFLGDHQPPVVTPQGAVHDVPITIVAKDPKVLDRIAGWGWQDGLHPGAQAPIWKMDSFRDRFLNAFAH
ncbi:MULTISPECIES: sulfatase-like hydrolase/transferase [unclassified Amycolatopsis]|uniref:sulfatase-like hydrolase/transferase n=1 Tax=unclassified Amycolatopsis TaxID=2618356 RepID=UPI002876E8CC|nr:MULTISPECIES: sulfatase-like hydrolase/transferase [unclassified Amycolatopsis]MDS0137177.1 sulfatase [Amycolatopsis sp. 505]MDS0143842.1 sulfatase [Amycolatopsis sp. CM201R]